MIYRRMLTVFALKMAHIFSDEHSLSATFFLGKSPVILMMLFQVYDFLFLVT